MAPEPASRLRRSARWIVPLSIVVLWTASAAAQERPAEPTGGTVPSAGPAAAVVSPEEQEPQDDMVLDPAQPDFTLVNLPTTLRLPAHRLSFRVTHRFFRELGQGDLGDLAADLFGLDSGAQIGLELRFGVMPGWQAGIYRTSDRTIELFTQYSVLQQRDGRLVSLDAWLTFEGTNNFAGDDRRQPTGRGQRSPGLGVVVSRVLGAHGAIYATPMWIHNTNPLEGDLADDNDTVLLGLGGRVRLRPTVYVVGEIVPRLAGYDPGATLAAFGIEKRVGGHAFQLNVSNGIGTTMAQVGRGGAARDTWFLGFNISRKFF